MKVNILNKNELTEIFEMWGNFSVICYNTPKKFAKKVGQSCLTTGHFSGSRARHIIFEFEGISRACADQMVRHDIGTAKNMQSGRYVNLEDFEYHIPTPIKNNSNALEIYIKHMADTKIAYKQICEALQEDGLKGEKVYECARGIAPMNHHTKLTMSFTIEALINFMNKRLCVCSQEEVQKVAREMRRQIVEIVPEFKEHLVPVCQSKLYCPESKNRSCGAYPQKSELKEALFLLKNMKKEFDNNEIVYKNYKMSENLK